MNTVNIIGNITRDCERKEIGSGTLTKFSVALNESWVDKNQERQERTHFIDCEGWRVSDNMAQYLVKGKKVGVEGSLKQDTWQDDDGNNRSKLSVNVHRIHLLGGDVAKGGAKETVAATADSSDDLPF